MRIRSTILYIFISMMGTLSAQNLVIDPSFEDTISCQTAIQPVDLFLNHWSTPLNAGSCHYLHRCWVTGFFIEPYQGDAKVRCQLYRDFENTLIDSMWGSSFHERQYITTQLNSPLVQGQCYEVKVTYSRAAYYSRYAVKDLGILFTNQYPEILPPPTPPETSPLFTNETPQINTNQYLIDSTGWSTITRYYMAEGGEQYLTLGGFLPHWEMDKLDIAPSRVYVGYASASLAYFDYISVTPTSTVQLDEINLDSTITICTGETLTLTTNLADSVVHVWNNLVDTNEFTVDTAGRYWVDAYSGCSFRTDTVNVEYLNIDFGFNDTALCQYEEIELFEDIEGGSYIWSTGDTTQHIKVSGSTPGVYWLEVDLQGRCLDRDTVIIRDTLPNDADLEKIDFSGIICVQDTLFAAASAWSNSYEWSTGDTTPYIVVNEAGLYEVETKNECDKVVSHFDIEVLSLTEGLHDYNIFTPNKDGENELFHIYTGDAEDYQLEIYNRWGQLIWRTENPSEYWDGGNVSDGVYYYRLSFTNCAGEFTERKGTVTLLK